MAEFLSLSRSISLSRPTLVLLSVPRLVCSGLGVGEEGTFPFSLIGGTFFQNANYMCLAPSLPPIILHISTLLDSQPLLVSFHKRYSFAHLFLCLCCAAVLQ
ncbi:hypothetical protein BJV74DRAFT_857276 [Russula compacta]|nr:hypothetical protein BJV74DRAFT_857276 [Russula compacta]